MFSVITNIYNKKTKGPTLMEFFITTGNLKKFFFFWQLEMFDVCTTGDTAHIDAIFKFLPHTRYGLNTKRLRRTLHTVVFDIDSSLAAIPVDFFGLYIKLTRTCSNVIFSVLWANTWFLLAQTPSFSKLFIPRTNGLVCRRVLCVLCTKCTLNSNHRLTRVIFQHTKRLLTPERPFSHYIHSHRLAAEMWTTMKNNIMGKTFSVVLSVFTGFVNTCNTVFPW